MSKVTKEQFDLFKKECRKWIDKFELNNWKVHFKLGDAGEGNRASINRNVTGYIASIHLADSWDKLNVSLTNAEIRQNAKHEIIHLLLGRYSAQARERFIIQSELDEAGEELVRKLEWIIR